MAKRPNDQMAKWQFVPPNNQIAKWPHEMPKAALQNGQMTKRQKDKTTKWQNNQMSS